MTLGMSDLVQRARQQLHDLTGLELGTTVSAQKADGRWRVRVEVVEKNSIPDSQDVLAIYELTVDEDGNVQDFTRTGMRKRMDLLVADAVESEV